MHCKNICSLGCFWTLLSLSQLQLLATETTMRGIKITQMCNNIKCRTRLCTMHNLFPMNMLGLFHDYFASPLSQCQNRFILLDYRSKDWQIKLIDKLFTDKYVQLDVQSPIMCTCRTTTACLCQLWNWVSLYRKAVVQQFTMLCSFMVGDSTSKAWCIEYNPIIKSCVSRFGRWISAVCTSVRKFQVNFESLHVRWYDRIHISIASYIIDLPIINNVIHACATLPGILMYMGRRLMVYT